MIVGESLYQHLSRGRCWSSGPWCRETVTGLVFSYDPGATKYVTLTDIQQPRVEVIESLQQMMEIALKRLMEGSGSPVPPKRVIFFRDGVSEGEYNTVATAELAAIRGT